KKCIRFRLCKLCAYSCREGAMARSTPKKSAKAKQAKRKPAKVKQAKRSKSLVVAANLAGIGDLNTFNIIRELNDRLAQSRGDTRAAKYARSSRAASSTARDAISDSPWVAIARSELG